MIESRPYQSKAEDAVISAWESHRRVLLVCPTGGGKTQMGTAILQKRKPRKAIWIAHRRELIHQACDRLRQIFGRFAVGMVMPGAPVEPHAEIQVASVQTLIARDSRPEADLMVFDEAHHIQADSYAEVAKYYGNALQLGLTATPQRFDGKPLGDMFDTLRVAAQYSELLRDGFLCPMRVYQPPDIPGSGYATDPLTAWQRYSGLTQTFAFFPDVAQATKWREAFDAAGIPSAIVSAKTKKLERHNALDAFKAGAVKVLFNVGIFTEGTDVPAAETILLGRQCGHVSIYLQIAGRALRPALGKAFARLIDLTGASIVHGLPLEDREYSLEGEGIKRTSVTSLKNCPQCGATILSAYRVCPECSYAFPFDPKRDPKIFDWDLEEVYAGKDTPDDAKARELRRLRMVANAKGYGIGWTAREYRKLFKEKMPLDGITDDDKRKEFERLKAIGTAKGFKPGFAYAVFKETFGVAPRF